MLRQRVARNHGLRAAAPGWVDVALVLAVDCSGSISTQNLALQFDGYAEAIVSEPFVQAIRSGHQGRILLTFLMWSSQDRQDQAVPWTVIEDAATARDFVAALRVAPAPTPGWTSISGAIDAATRLLANSPLAARRRVIDVSGDGGNNDGRLVEAARDDAVAQDIVINGLPVLGAQAGIEEYYAGHVVGGPHAFVMVARDLGSFRQAVLEKLIAEIA